MGADAAEAVSSQHAQQQGVEQLPCLASVGPGAQEGPSGIRLETATSS